MSSYNELELAVVQWAEARGIIQNSTAEAQFMKAVSEIGELADALNKGRMDEVKDAVGDVLVCLINMCAILDISVVQCLAGAYQEIKNRKGYLTPEGVFVKEVKV